MTKYPSIYPEIHRPIEIRGAVAFPVKCPTCNAPTTLENNATDTPDYRRSITYRCGGSYTNKSQIQNHTEKWWGMCPKGTTR